MNVPEVIKIDDVEYVRKDIGTVLTPVSDIYIVRTFSAGVFFGEIVSRNGQEVVMKNARRVWYWSGAASLSQMANEGVKNPSKCKFPAPVSEVTLLQVIEILRVTEQAKQNLVNVPVWSS